MKVLQLFSIILCFSFVFSCNQKKDDSMTKKYYPSGELNMEYKTVNGEVEGILKAYYKNGQLQSESNHVAGKKEGLVVMYFPSGKIMAKENYTKGTRHGNSEAYYENGNLKSTSIFHHGDLVYSEKYDLKGTITKGIAFPIITQKKDTFIVGETYDVLVYHPKPKENKKYTCKGIMTEKGKETSVEDMPWLTMKNEKEAQFSITLNETGDFQFLGILGYEEEDNFVYDKFHTSFHVKEQ